MDSKDILMCICSGLCVFGFILWVIYVVLSIIKKGKCKIPICAYITSTSCVSFYQDKFHDVNTDYYMRVKVKYHYNCIDYETWVFGHILRGSVVDNDLDILINENNPNECIFDMKKINAKRAKAFRPYFEEQIRKRREERQKNKK